MSNRMRLAVAGTALAITAPLVSMTTAVADDAAVAQPAQTVQAKQAKERRTITIKGVEPRQNVFIAKGRVSPEYKKRAAVMQRKRKSAKHWSNSFKFKTNATSRYRQRIAPLKKSGVVCYRVKIVGNKKFKTSYSDQVCIRTF
jgi:hypothetical protein